MLHSTEFNKQYCSIVVCFAKPHREFVVKTFNSFYGHRNAVPHRLLSLNSPLDVVLV